MQIYDEGIEVVFNHVIEENPKNGEIGKITGIRKPSVGIMYRIEFPDGTGFWATPEELMPVKPETNLTRAWERLSANSFFKAVVKMAFINGYMEKNKPKPEEFNQAEIEASLAFNEWWQKRSKK